MSEQHRNWLRRAQPPIEPVPIASEFSNWVFRESIGPRENHTEIDRVKHSLMQLGEIAHQDIETFFMLHWTRNTLGIPDSSGWKLEFADNRMQARKIYRATALRVGLDPLRCKPDVVLRNEKENKVLIIERKTTFVPTPFIPVDGWPNVEAQLWCYSWVDDWKTADEVILVGQLWQRSGRGAMSLCHSHPYWRRNDTKHHQRCLEWFEKYGGSFRRDEE